MKDKNVFNSKKYAAFFYAVSIVAAIVIVGIIKQPQMNIWTAFLLGIGMIIIGALALGYIINQRALDRFLSSVSSMTGAITGKGDGDGKDD
jgi:hypothetical protein